MTTPDWGHIFETFLTVTVPVLLFMWKNRLAGKKDSDTKHAQNQKKIDLVIQDLGYYPPHQHVEKSGPLTYDGIRVAPQRNGNS